MSKGMFIKILTELRKKQHINKKAVKNQKQKTNKNKT